MATHKATAVRHLSYEQLDMLLRSLAESVASDTTIASLWHSGNSDDIIMVHLLSTFSEKPIDPQGTRFSLFGDITTPICLFRKIHTSSLYNKSVKHYIEDIYQEDDESFMRITLPWKK